MRLFNHWIHPFAVKSHTRFEMMFRKPRDAQAFLDIRSNRRQLAAIANRVQESVRDVVPLDARKKCSLCDNVCGERGQSFSESLREIHQKRPLNDVEGTSLVH
jgi:hypothetical protein